MDKKTEDSPTLKRWAWAYWHRKPKRLKMDQESSDGAEAVQLKCLRGRWEAQLMIALAVLLALSPTILFAVAIIVILITHNLWVAGAIWSVGLVLFGVLYWEQITRAFIRQTGWMKQTITKLGHLKSVTYLYPGGFQGNSISVLCIGQPALAWLKDNHDFLVKLDDVITARFDHPAHISLELELSNEWLRFIRRQPHVRHADINLDRFEEDPQLALETLVQIYVEWKP